MLVASVVVLWGIVLVLAVLVVLLYRQFGLIYIGSRDRVAQTGLRVGAAAPEGLPLRVNGEEIAWSWRQENGVQASLALMSAPECKLCTTLIPGLEDVTNRWRGVARIVVVDRISPGSAPPRDVLADSGWTYALDETGRTHERFDVQATPFAFVIDAAGKVREKGVVNYPESLDLMLRRAIEQEPVGIVPGLLPITTTNSEVRDE
jgi:hypothetical protein